MSSSATKEAPLILVVDDQRFMRKLARDWLEEAGFAVEEAADGAEALSAFRRLHPDLVLLDVIMPVMDGFAACAELRKLPGGAHTPVLVMTGLEDAESIKRAYEAGATDFIHKPINGVVLGYRIRYILRASETARQLRESQKKLVNAQRIAGLGYWEFAVPSGELTWSADVHRIFGVPPETLPPTRQAFLEWVHPDDRHSVTRLIDQVLEDARPRGTEFRLICPDRSERIVQQQAEVAVDDAHTVFQVTGTVQDVTERRRAEEQIRFLASYDTVTGLPNRRQIMDYLKLQLTRPTGQARWVANLFLGVHHFKRVNDTLGHKAGDQLLREVAKRLVEGLRAPNGGAPARSSDQDPFVGCFGGDEFVVILNDVGRIQDVARFARGIIRALERPFTLEGQEVFTTASVGISLYPIDGTDADSLLQNAATAMSHAKYHGDPEYQFYTESMNSTAFQQLVLESGLRKALERHEFTLHYQPQIDLASGEIVGAEALIRWESPELGMIWPLEFIPLAEETGLIFPIGDWVFRSACAQAKQWQDAGFRPLRVAVNVSARQFGQQDFTRGISLALQSAGLDPCYLDSELTETTVMRDVDSAILSLKEMKAMGLHVSVDDFGTGYSSLSYLERFPIDALKIDRSFLEGLPSDPEHAAITTAIIAMAKSLNMRVIAEGVQSKQQLAFLREKGCDEAQGHLFSYPIPPDDFVQLLTKEWDPTVWRAPGS